MEFARADRAGTGSHPDRAGPRRRLSTRRKSADRDPRLSRQVGLAGARSRRGRRRHALGLNRGIPQIGWTSWREREWLAWYVRGGAEYVKKTLSKKRQ